VSWDDTIGEYIPWLNRRTGETYRLLTETEWEYAARAGSERARERESFHFGNRERDLCTFANFADLTAKENDKDWPAAKMANCRDGYVFTAPGGLVPGQHLRASRHAPQCGGVDAELHGGGQTAESLSPPPRMRAKTCLR
jgi:formylglycine-generating enzyme required for sulfatase activity